MMAWFKQWRINRLLKKLAYQQAFAERLNACGFTAGPAYGDIAALKEKLRQLDHSA